MKTICFDLDGTLTDPKTGITRCIQHALKELGAEVVQEEGLIWCIGPPLLQSFEKLLATKNDAQLALTKYRERFSQVGIFENTIYPDIPETLTALKDCGYRLFVATSKPTVYAVRIIEHFNLSSYFDDVCGSELDGTRSDKTALLSWVLERHQIDPARATMVGDRSHDIIGAVNNNMNAIGVLYGYGSKAELIDAGAKTLCHSPQDISSFLNK